ncbi:MAG: PD-(D/E)XK nuclease family protein [Actinomycetota bacterium]|nr:PD-(D/E)XK nuclease family protein [Actinomycetota bacterium]
MWTQAEREALNRPQRRVVDALLAADRPRPPGDPALAGALAAFLRERTAEAAALVPAGQRLVVSKSALDALDCDGRFVDRGDGQFAWSPAMVRGELAHSAIAVDLEGGRRRPPAAVMAYAWARFATSGEPAGRYLATLGGVEADALRAEAQDILLEFRDLFPPLPPTVQLRTDPQLTVALHDRQVELRGRPDLMIGRATVDRRRLLLIDLKSGQRHPWRDRADMRFYALLAALKYGVAPFRVATLYLDEADWDAEDIEADALEAAARALTDKVGRAARLTYARPPRDVWRLSPGPGCSWCGFARDCGAKAAADAEHAARSGGR